MKLTILKKKIFKELIIIGIIVSAVCGVMYYSMLRVQGLEKELSDFSRESATLSGKIRGSKAEHEKIIKAFEYFNKIKKNKYPTKNGYSSAASRIRIAGPIIKNLQSRFHFTELKTSFSKSISSSSDYKSDKFSIIDNEITFEFKAFSDELVFSFIKTAIEEFPGYLKMKSLQIKRLNDVSEGVLVKIRNEKEKSAIVSGRIVFLWKTIKGDFTTSKKGESSNEKEI